MLRIFMLIAGFGLLASVSDITPVRADTWGCSYDKCLAACAKTGGSRCNQYCTRRMREKQQDKTCS